MAKFQTVILFLSQFYSCDFPHFFQDVMKILKVSKNRKQIFQPKLLPKTEQSICFSILISSQDRKTNSLVRFLEEVLAGKFAFEIYGPLGRDRL